MQKNSKLKTIIFCGALATFVGMALACSSSDQESIRKGAEFGAEIGRAAAGGTSDAAIDSMKNNLPDTYFSVPELPEVAENTHK